MTQEKHQLFTEMLDKQGILLSDKQVAQFDYYFHELVAWNEKINLTAITDRDQVYIKHFYDSLSLSFFFPLQSISTIADIGSGAGFPGIPLKIMFPHLKLTIVDSLNKRIQFLEHLVSGLELENVQCIHSRAEDAGRKEYLRDSFDLVTARAVARLHILNELCLPFVKQDGYFIAMKGSDPQQEIKDAARSMKLLRAELANVFSFELPMEESSRHLVVLKKLAQTPLKYPRKAGTPAKSPLI